MTTVSRRKFLQLGLSGAATLAAANMWGRIDATELIEGGASVSRTTNVARVGIPSICNQCDARCGIIGFVEEGKLVKIEGNPRDLNNRGRLCAKGHAGLNYLYNPDRQFYPLKRVGLRGQGKWKRIDWDEAYAEVAARIGAVRSNGNPSELVFLSGLDGQDAIVSRFLRAYGTRSVLLEKAPHKANKWVGQELTWGASYDVADAANSKYIVNFGANPYETHPHFVPLIQQIINGRMNGARLVTFDSRLSHTASKSDKWLPIKPGTDGLVALAMANVIMQRGLYDSAFLELWLNYRPDLLTTHLSQYTPELAEHESGVKAAEIVRVAVEFATTKPAVAIAGGGISSHVNGVQNERAVALLNAITGNIDVRGGSCLPRNYEFTDPNPAPPSTTTGLGLAQSSDFPLAAYAVPQRAMSTIKEGRQKVGAVIAFQSNPAFTFPDTETTISVLKDEKLVPFSVAIDSYITETAALADIILPAATYLESWGIESPPSYHLLPSVSLRQPIIKPLGESIPTHDIRIELAKRIDDGMEKYFDFGTMPNFIEASIGRIDGMQRAGGLNYLKANGVWIDANAPVVYKSYEKGGFNTPSRKFEVFSRRLEIAGFSPLPVYERPAGLRDLGPVVSSVGENAPGAQDAGHNTFAMITFQSSVHTDASTAVSMWLNEIAHDNPLWINAEVAKEQGIKRGDTLVVTSALGSVKVTAWPTQGIHPNVVAIGGNGGHWEYSRVAKGERFDSQEPNTKLIWWGKKAHGAHIQQVVPTSPDPIGGGQAWSGTIVTISKE